MQRFVVDPEESRRLALVAPRRAQRQPDCLPLRLGGGSLRDFLQRGTVVFVLPSVRSHHLQDLSPPFKSFATRGPTGAPTSTECQRELTMRSESGGEAAGNAADEMNRAQASR